MSNLLGRTNFDPFSKTWKFFAQKISMKYSKNGRNFATFKNTSNVLIATYWTAYKKPHISEWSNSRIKIHFFLMTLFRSSPSSYYGPDHLSDYVPNFYVSGFRFYTGPLTHPFARSLAPFTHSLAPHCSIHLCAPLRSFVRLLTQSITPELVGK